MIIRIKNRKLRAFWLHADAGGLNPSWVNKIDRIMNALDVAESPADLDFPGWRLHALRGRLRGYYAVDVSRNWRMVFRFDNGNATDVDLVDYH
jgi:proteic killer suppression protein